MPPSAATIQYPSPLGVAAMPTMGEFNLVAPNAPNTRLPKNGALPYANTPPSDAAIQYPALALSVPCTTPHATRAPASPVAIVAASGPVAGGLAALDVY